MSKSTLADSIDVSSRQKRRAAVAVAAGILQSVYAAENKRIYNTPTNLLDSEAFAAAQDDASTIWCALDVLCDAYTHVCRRAQQPAS